MVALGVGTLVLLGGAGKAAAHRMHGGHMEGMFGRRLEAMLDEVKATPEQRQQITAIKDELVEKRKALWATKKATHQEMLAQWESANPDLGAIHARIDERAKEMSAFAHEVADALGKAHAILTPEQRAQLATKWREKLERHGAPQP
jgi:Spy/CpxP family protein refolding chaperone